MNSPQPLPSRVSVALALCAAPVAAQTELFHLQGAAGEELGTALVATGDLDGDGHADLATLTNEAAHRKLRAYSSVDGALLFSVPTPDSLTSILGGANLVATNDLDGDSVPDLVVAAQDGAGSWTGAATAFSGADGAQLWQTAGQSSSDLFGSSLANLGDVDGDGVDDLVVGALSVEPAGGSGQTNTGSMTLLSGADGSEIWNVYGPSYAPTGFACSMGHRLSAVGDQNGDTLVDFVATGSKTTTVDGQGATVICPMQVYSGADGSVLGEIAQPPAFSPFDLPVATPGDTNGDQVPEIAIAYPYLTSTISQQGAVKLFDGATGSLLKTWWGTSSTQGFGYALVPAGDMDGDGTGDLLIGAKSFPVLAGGHGIARAVSGKTYQVLHEVPAPSTPTIEPNGFSLTLAGLGDIDGDGGSEFAVGAPGYETASGQEEFGRITVYSSAKPPLLGSPAWIPGYPGGSQSLKLDLGPAHAGELYIVGGSVAGYAPPTPLQGFAVPLVIDGYTVAGLSGGSLVSSILGVLDGNGVGAKQIAIPPLLGQVLLSVYGTTFWHAAITLNGAGGVTAVTNAVPLTITL